MDHFLSEITILQCPRILPLNLCPFPGVQGVVCAEAAVKMSVKLVEHRVAVAKVSRRHGIGPVSHTMAGDAGEGGVGIEAYHVLPHFVNGFRAESHGPGAAPRVGAVDIGGHTGEEVTEARAAGRGRRGFFLRWTVSPRWGVFQDILMLCSFGAARQGTVLRFLRCKSSSTGLNVRLPLPLPAEVPVVKHLFTVWVQSPVIPFSFQRKQTHTFSLKIWTRTNKQKQSFRA